MPLNTQAPAGAHFEFEQLNTARGTKPLPRQTPRLVYDTVAAATATLGEQGVLDVLDGTSLCVSFQGIARRMCLAGKTDDEIAAAQTAFRPGSRVVGAATPTSRAVRGVKAASEKVDGDLLAAFMAKIASGEISEEDVKAFVA